MRHGKDVASRYVDNDNPGNWCPALRNESLQAQLQVGVEACRVQLAIVIGHIRRVILPKDVKVRRKSNPR